MNDAKNRPNPLIVFACRTYRVRPSHTRVHVWEMVGGQLRHASTIKDLAVIHASSVRHPCVTRWYHPVFE